MLHHTLVAVDGSDHANKAVDLAPDLANRYEADLTVLHVMSDPGDMRSRPASRSLLPWNKWF